jgi:oligopeptide/dipeptide ABC transporter ATP-binding protein
MRKKIDGAREILRVHDLKKYFPMENAFLSFKREELRAVDGVSFQLYEGETLGIAGESGCGKSTLGRVILRLLEKTSGDVLFEGVNIHNVSDEKFREIRNRMQNVFQDPFSSLNPWMTVFQLIAEPLKLYKYVEKTKIEEKVLELLAKVGFNDTIDLKKYPHEFSGGQRQRICIARAIALNPKLVVCDETVSALDVSIQSQVINLLVDLQREFGLTYIFISHNFPVIQNIADRVAVMYLGKFMEVCQVDELFRNPRHPYSILLLSSIPSPDVDVKRKRVNYNGDIPNPMKCVHGCGFYSRCEYRTELCRNEEPILADIGKGHFVACHMEKGVCYSKYSFNFEI